VLGYPVEKVTSLPWDPRGETLPGDFLGILLRDLYGLTRANWLHPADSAVAIGAPPELGVFRPAPSGGALYPIEIYLATPKAPGMPAALHHYDPVHHVLHLLRDGDHRAALADLLIAPPADPPDLLLVLTTVFWRNAFKYQEFGYRLQHQETGVLIAQAHAVTGRLGGTVTAHLRYPDEQVNQLLGLDTFRQSATAVLAVRHPSVRYRRAPLSRATLLDRPIVAVAEPPPDISRLLPATAAIHAASLVERPGALPPAPPEPPATVGPPIRLPRADVHPAAGLRGRASARNGFRPEPLSARMLAGILAAASDFGGIGDAPAAIDVYCLVTRVDGVQTGAYRHHRGMLEPVGGSEAVEQVSGGLVTRPTWLAFRTAAIALVPVAAMTPGLSSFGDRWYRLVQTATGMVAHRAELAAAALGLAARIHSDATTDATDRALGLAATSQSSQTMLMIGAPQYGKALDIPLFGAARNGFAGGRNGPD
jgi:SagB-type dehydrogenase family enzyme